MVIVRQIVNFDPNNIQHRSDFKTLMEYRSLSRCNYRYNLEAPYFDILTMMKERMLQYYLKIDI